MDSLTHTVLGACLGEVIAGKKLGKKALWIGALVNNLPDVDMIANFWSTQAEGLLTHRGITHSFLFAVLITPLLIFLFKKMMPENTLSNKRWTVLVGHGLFLHIFMDAFTAYGTGWFEPFSHARVSFNSFFILDPFFMLPLLTVFVGLLIVNKQKHSLRNKMAVVALGLSASYLLLTLAIKAHVNAVLQREITRQQFNAKSYLSTPTALNNMLWYSVVNEDDKYHIGYYSILDASENISFETVFKNDSLLNPYKGSNDVKLLQRFSQNLYSMQTNSAGVIFSDMRFGQIGFAPGSTKTFVFNFDIFRNKNDRIVVKQSAFRPMKSGEFRALYERVKGSKKITP